jgi:hypothetical protein
LRDTSYGRCIAIALCAARLRGCIPQLRAARRADRHGSPAHPERGYGIALGTLDSDLELRPERHVFVANKAPWFKTTDDLPQQPRNDRIYQCVA